MMRKLLAAVAMAAVCLSGNALAADHGDGPAAVADKNADIADTYAWTDPGGDKMNLVVTFAPDAAQDARLSDAVLYVFNLTSKQTFDATTREQLRIVCSFDVSENVSCWAGDSEYVQGDARSSQGLLSSSGRMRVFTGLRNDAFFFNIRGFKKTVETVQGAAPNLLFDQAGCPDVDAATSTALVTQLQTDEDLSAAKDNFAGQRVQVIALQLDKALVTQGGPILGVWASTHRKQ